MHFVLDACLCENARCYEKCRVRWQLEKFIPQFEIHSGIDCFILQFVCMVKEVLKFMTNIEQTDHSAFISPWLNVFSAFFDKFVHAILAQTLLCPVA